MRILYIITKGDQIGGAQVNLIQLINYFSEKFNQVALVYGGTGDKIETLVGNESLTKFRIPRFSNKFNLILDLINLILVMKFVYKWKPDLIHIHSTKAGIIFRFVGVIFRKPVVYTVHGWGFTEGVPKRQAKIVLLLEKVLRSFVSYYILVSKYDYNLGISVGILDRPNFKLVYNSYGRSNNEIEKDYDFSKGLKIVMVARFDYQKDHKTLLSAVANLTGCELFLIGDGPLRNEVEKEYNSSNSIRNVHFLGRRSNVRELLSKMDLFVLISNFEGFPISTLEAMSMGLPVIVSDVGGAGEPLLYGDIGFTVPRGDVKELRLKIKWCINNRIELRNMGITAKSVALNYFNEGVMFDQINDIYLRLNSKVKSDFVN